MSLPEKENQPNSGETISSEGNEKEPNAVQQKNPYKVTEQSWKLLEEAFQEEGQVTSPLPSKKRENSQSVTKIELAIENIFKDQHIQEHIREKLRKLLMDELSRLSPLLRNSLREWINNYQKNPNNALVPRDQIIPLERRIQELVNENNDLKRKVELKEKEAKLMLSALKKF